MAGRMVADDPDMKVYLRGIGATIPAFARAVGLFGDEAPVVDGADHRSPRAADRLPLGAAHRRPAGMPDARRRRSSRLQRMLFAAASRVRPLLEQDAPAR
jgi:hypothetical protein